MFTRMTAISAALALTATVFSPASAMAERTLKAAVFLPTQLAFAEPAVLFADKVNEIGKGVLQINLVGPDAIPAVEQSNALRSGLLDIAAIPPSLYKQQVPLGNAQDISDVPVAEQRESGAYEYLRQMTMDQLGSYLLTTYGDGVGFHIYLNKEISSLDDLKGMRVRSSPLYTVFFENLGLRTTNTPVPETFTALERGVVDGYGWPFWGIQDLGWDKYTKVRIDPGFYNVTINILVNGDTWAGLSDDERKVLEDAAAWLDEELPKFNAEKDALNKKVQDEAGIVSFDAGPEFAKQAGDTYWGEMAKIDADGTAKLREMFQK
ncbi:TRAP transporter substrate-binding protein DctP [Albibacillus kandeliae]|uniref:TRAP transporter substrate-binding protein DctP n=1 Tax=Albibacillus kandeliae TaxID=2174228 RepID=UPI000D694966|nr:TRAP transporter substrate-binding protein DctP [Albibacillus kandeliae]